MSDTKSFQLTTVSFRCYNVQAQLIAEAAEGANMTVSDYGRELLVSDAARRLGRALPMVPPIIRGRGGSLIAQAASKLGLSRAEFEDYASRLAAADVLGMTVHKAEEAPAAPVTERKGSGTRPAVGRRTA